MLRAILNKSWRQHPTKQQLYCYLPPITKAIKVRRARTLLEKQGWAHKWWSMDPALGLAKAGWPAKTYLQQLCEDTGYSPEDLPEAMNDREEWWERVRDIHASGMTWWWWWWWPPSLREDTFKNIHTETVFTKMVITNECKTNFSENSHLEIQHTHFIDSLPLVKAPLEFLLIWH